MLKIKFFFHDLNRSINQWLAQNPNITIINTNIAADNGGWLYSILYQEGVSTDE